MARIPYADSSSENVRSLAGRITAERGKVLELYQMLLHSPPVAEGWLGFLTAIRQRTVVPGHQRELIIMRVAHLNKASYEAEQHRPYALREGLTNAQLNDLCRWTTSTLFDEQQKAVLAYTDAMTCDVQVPDVVFDQLASQFKNDVIVEITATIAAYNMVSRFLEALQIHSQDDK